MNPTTLALGTCLLVAALAVPYSLVGLEELSPTGEAQALQCRTTSAALNPYTCCPFNKLVTGHGVDEAAECVL